MSSCGNCAIASDRHQREIVELRVKIESSTAQHGVDIATIDDLRRKLAAATDTQSEVSQQQLQFHSIHAAAIEKVMTKNARLKDDVSDYLDRNDQLRHSLQREKHKRREAERELSLDRDGRKYHRSYSKLEYRSEVENRDIIVQLLLVILRVHHLFCFFSPLRLNSFGS